MLIALTYNYYSCLRDIIKNIAIKLKESTKRNWLCRVKSYSERKQYLFNIRRGYTYEINHEPPFFLYHYYHCCCCTKRIVSDIN